MNTAKEISSKTDAPTLHNEYGISVHGVYELTKPRLSLLSVFTASLGYLVHDPLVNNFSIFVALTTGTAFSAAGAAALNQWLERKEDALMPRTSNRPIPAKLVSPQFAFFFGIFISIIGLTILLLGTNAWAFSFTLLTLIAYLLLYTPLKKKSHFAIEVGAISGALPPLIGWVAAANSPTTYGWILFGILFAWQLPHFLAIAWNFREDYQRGGFQFHDSGDPTGVALGRKSFIYTLLLNFFVFSPFLFNLGEGYRQPGVFYLVCAILLTLFITLRSLDFCFGKDRNRSAKHLFIASIVYLPLLLSALVIDRYL